MNMWQRVNALRLRFVRLSLIPSLGMMQMNAREVVKDMVRELSDAVDSGRPPIPINTIDQCDEAEQIVRKALSVINHRRRWLHMLDQRSECPSSAEVNEQRAKTVARYAEFRKMRDRHER